jgi:hypothetical protein
MEAPPWWGLVKATHALGHQTGSASRGKTRTSLKLSVLATLHSFYRHVRGAQQLRLREAGSTPYHVLVLDEAAKPASPRRNPIVLAEEWRGRLVAGEVRSRADLARMLGVSRARVTQVLALLSLPSDLQDKVKALGDPLLAPPPVSEKALRRLVPLAVDQQREAMQRLGL